MPYLVDGHNLIGRYPGLSLRDPEDEQKLLVLLQQFGNRTRRRMVIFFDRGVPLNTSLSRGVIEARFVRPPRQADEALLHYLRQIRDPANWTVVTSDREVAQDARALGARVLASERFAQAVAKALQKAPADQTPKEGAAELDEWIDLFGGEKD